MRMMKPQRLVLRWARQARAVHLAMLRLAPLSQAAGSVLWRLQQWLRAVWPSAPCRSPFLFLLCAYAFHSDSLE